MNIKQSTLSGLYKSVNQNKLNELAKMLISEARLQELMTKGLDYSTAKSLEAETKIKAAIWRSLLNRKPFKSIQPKDLRVIRDPTLAPQWDYGYHISDYYSMIKDCGYGMWKPSIPDGVDMAQIYLENNEISSLGSEIKRLRLWAGLKESQIAKLSGMHILAVLLMQSNRKIPLNKLRKVIEDGLGGTLILNIVIPCLDYKSTSEYQILSYTAEMDNMLVSKITQVRKELTIGKVSLGARINKTKAYMEMLERGEKELSLPILCDIVNKGFGGHISLNAIILNDLEENILFI